jgi:drug/metabolite transporter (DMT)-like permease
VTSDAGRSAQERGAAFILVDMVLVVIMLAVVKQAGASFPPAQLVFLRALVGLLLIVPLAWRHREPCGPPGGWAAHVGRVLCSALALGCNFTAVVALPLALVTAIGFTRPFVVLALAVLVLGERVSRTRWIASILCFAGVLVMTRPGEVVWDWALLAAFGSVLFGSIATIQTRRLAGESTIVLMVFYTWGSPS